MRLTAALHGASFPGRCLAARRPQDRAVRSRATRWRLRRPCSRSPSACNRPSRNKLLPRCAARRRRRRPSRGAQADGHVRVIVLLNAPNVANQVRPNAATIASIKARVAALQNNVLANHFGDAVNLRPGRGFVRHHTRFEITPGFAVNVDATELEALAADPTVKSITIDHLRRAKLLQSLPLIGQPTAYTTARPGPAGRLPCSTPGCRRTTSF